MEPDASGLLILEEEGGCWERWTIDEMLDGRVRLLVSEARGAAAQAAVRALGVTLQNGRGVSVAEVIHALAMDQELALPESTWSTEEAMFVDAEELAALLRRRVRRHLPGSRPLREGDVFWVLIPGCDTHAPHALARLTSSVEPYISTRPIVLDLTVAARQASKVRDSRAAVNTDQRRRG